jgi:hypothetical protein
MAQQNLLEIEMTPINSTFTRFQLTQEETTSGQSLTSTNIAVIQNLICDCAEERLSLKYDPSNPIIWAQREAELQGQIGILKLLLELSSQSNQVHII